MASKPKQKLTIAFDLYGTLLDTSSIATDLAQVLGPDFPQDKANLLAAKWRQYQLEYTWRLTSQASPYLPFDKLTRAALLHACQEAGVHLAPAKADALMRSYDSLQTFAEVLPALRTLAEASRAGRVRAVVFSNGTPAMLAGSIATAPTLKLFQEGGGGEAKSEDESKGEAPLFGKLISVDAVQRYKPAPEVYEYLQREAAGPGSDYKAQAAVWLVSSNAFDVVGARAAGVRAVWVDRQGTGWVDQLGQVVSDSGGGKTDVTPTIVVKGVDEAVDKILAVGI
ncbi:unnamed protein product [Discula destructiva]